MSFMVALSFDDVLMYKKTLSDHFMSKIFSTLFNTQPIFPFCVCHFRSNFPYNDPAESAHSQCAYVREKVVSMF